MSQPQFCRNPECPHARVAPSGWFVRDGTYWCKAHGRVPHYKCKECGRKLSGQTESMHYFAKRRLDLKTIAQRVCSGSSMRHIGRDLHCSPNAVANAVVRLGRQAIACRGALGWRPRLHALGDAISLLVRELSQ